MSVTKYEEQQDYPDLYINEHELTEATRDGFRNLFLSNDPSKKLLLSEKLIQNLQEFQAQPLLLDKVIGEFLPELNSRFLHPTERLISCSLFYELCKIKGYKTLLLSFVTDISLIERLVDELSNDECESWKVHYTYLLWLSQVIQAPFPLKTLEQKPNLEVRVLNLLISFLKLPGKNRDASVVALGRFLSRSDTVQLLPQFIHYAISLLNGSKQTDYSILGCLETVAQFLKFVERSVFLPFEDLIFRFLRLYKKFITPEDTLLQKFACKAAYRFALLLLPLKSSEQWRFSKYALSNFEQYPEDNNVEVHEDVEYSVDILLDSITHKDTVVRWSAAKGLARIVERLPWFFAEQVMDAVFDILMENAFRDPVTNEWNLTVTNPNSWHGAVLCFSELASHGLLKKRTLDKLVPLMLLSLVYEVRNGTKVSGSNVRDAADYFVWSLYRVYTEKELASYTEELAIQVALTALFDRELNVRRASSAAFQEMTGRNTCVPYGVHLVSTLGFYAVTDRTACFTKISVEVAQYDSYCLPIINRLIDKLHYWDAEIRSLAVQALAALACVYPHEILPKVQTLIERLSTSQLGHIHGDLLALCAIYQAVESTNKTLLEKSYTQFLYNYEQYLPVTLFHEFQGFELSSILLSFISCVCKNAAPPDNDFLERSLSHLSAAISLQDEMLHSKIAETFALLYQYEHIAVKTSVFLKTLNTSSLLSTQLCYVLMFAAVKWKESQYYVPVFQALSTLYTDKKTCIELQKEVSLFCYNSVDYVLQNLEENYLDTFVSLVFNFGNNYHIDSRGDTGSWVRQYAVQAIAVLLLGDAEVKRLKESQIRTSLSLLVRLRFDRIDKIRVSANDALVNSRNHYLIKGDKPLCDVLESFSSTTWAASNYVSKTTINLLNVPSMFDSAFHGLVLLLCDGFGNEVVTSAYSNFLLYLDLLPVSKSSSEFTALEDIFDFLEHFISNAATEVPLWVSSVRLLTSLLVRGYFLNFISPKRLLLISFHAQRRVKQFKSFSTLQYILRLYQSTLLVQHEKVWVQVMKYITNLLVHPMLKLRLHVAECLLYGLQQPHAIPLPSSIYEQLLTTDWLSNTPAHIKLIQSLKDQWQRKVKT
ncbi:tubulin specific chaperone cofactor D [Schizosaccharomyces japonicus yFS275]|uniref:Tubulin specific chaperone cofactor D n=1 Tax=Schizosaccharomyces japonicus (strain yFS275 / FY16936) TaxID=402676 RepID=B6K5U8_SCHJY|nr:tubulin specific chaperone cofactor D [Schizosaccharomyces japonicus yFS275]EEB08902.2 tubulin specific chaperone cofactor D [Schizosaccharomyces japonicus yFS275]